MIVAFYYYRFKLSLDDVVVLMAMRNISLSHQTVANWVYRFGVDIGIKMRSRRYKQCGDRWHVDAINIKVEGRWCSLYRAIDKEGNLVDVYLSDVRDQAAAESFFKLAVKTCGIYPYMMTTDHRGPKSRIDAMKGFNNILNAQIFCTVFEEIRRFFRMKNKTRSEKCRLFAPGFRDFNQLAIR